MTELEYIHAGNIKAIELARDALNAMLLIDDQDYSPMLDDESIDGYPNLNIQELRKIRTTLSVWHSILFHYLPEFEQVEEIE